MVYLVYNVLIPNHSIRLSDNAIYRKSRVHAPQYRGLATTNTHTQYTQADNERYRGDGHPPQLNEPCSERKSSELEPVMLHIRVDRILGEFFRPPKNYSILERGSKNWNF